MEEPAAPSCSVTNVWLSGMSPEAADFASAESAAGDPAVVAEPVAAEPDPEDPQPAAMSAMAAKTVAHGETMIAASAASIPRGP